jgi:hypothetical protein
MLLMPHLPCMHASQPHAPDGVVALLLVQRSTPQALPLGCRRTSLAQRPPHTTHTATHAPIPAKPAPCACHRCPRCSIQPIAAILQVAASKQAPSRGT